MTGEPRSGLPPLRDNAGRRAVMDGARDGLNRLPDSAARRMALSLLDDMGSGSSLQSWVFLRDLLGGLDPSLMPPIKSECESVHSETLASARTGADVIPVLHSICSSFVGAYASCMDSWRLAMRNVVGSFARGIKLGGAIQDYVVAMARTGMPPSPDAFVIMVQEIYARNGHYGAICDICEKIMEFEDEDAQYVLHHAHVERSIASLADYAIANGFDDGAIMDRCVDILKRRAKSAGTEVSLPSGKPTFRAISDSAQSLAQLRKPQNPSSWLSRYPRDYPFMYDKFTKTVDSTKPLPPGTVQREQDGLNALYHITMILANAYSSNLLRLRHIMSVITGCVKHISFDSTLQNYIVAMAKFDTGADDEMIYGILGYFCIQCEMYVGVCDICETMNKFKGANAQRMAASKLIEHALADILFYHSPSSPSDSLVDRCASLLEQRSDVLGLGISLRNYRDDKPTKAQLLASDIARRMRIRSSSDISAWIRVRYPLSYEFLRIYKNIDSLVASKSTLAVHVSDLMANIDPPRNQKRGYIPNRALDELEALLVTMEKIRLDSNDHSSKWKDDMLTFELWDALLEINLYVRCKKAGLNATPHPPIDGGHNADLKVGECYIEVYSPRDGLRTATGHIDRDSISKLCRNIMDKPQNKFFGKRQSMLVVKCYWDRFNDKFLHDLLKTEVKNIRCLGGILLILESDDRYETLFIENENANLQFENPL